MSRNLAVNTVNPLEFPKNIRDLGKMSLGLGAGKSPPLTGKIQRRIREMKQQ
jgi:hypothetical protein